MSPSISPSPYVYPNTTIWYNANTTGDVLIGNGTISVYSTGGGGTFSTSGTIGSASCYVDVNGTDK